MVVMVTFTIVTVTKERRLQIGKRLLSSFKRPRRRVNSAGHPSFNIFSNFQTHLHFPAWSFTLLLLNKVLMTQRCVQGT